MIVQSFAVRSANSPKISSPVCVSRFSVGSSASRIAGPAVGVRDEDVRQIAGADVRQSIYPSTRPEVDGDSLITAAQDIDIAGFGKTIKSG
tara:strand:+ start:245 stop:517 length:273 start_codon:yes stop_codon:yes gene_type:complete